MENKDAVKTDFQELWESLFVYDNKIKEINEKRQVNQANVINKRLGNQEITPDDLKEEFKEAQRLGYELTLIEDHLRINIHKLEYTYLLSQKIGVDLELPEEMKNDLEKILLNNKQLFMVSKGQVEILDEEFYKTLVKGLDERMEDPKSLEHIFNSVAYTPK